MDTLKLILFGVLAFVPLASAWADLVVVANPKSGIDKMSREEVVFVFMGRWRQLPSGIAAQPVDSPTDSPERTAFYRQLVNKSPSEIKAYWSRLVFSGGARPPVSPDSHAEQVRILASTPGAVSYVERSTVDSRVKIVFDFAQPTP
ncbi:MAG: hypothetical protein KA779_08600 [Propionivibrio sp.]|jgi:hypothetical protein|nr:hypothetical protein [Propionivibrio sp.]MBP6711475.1 hypothetical protein [Propionivibrio sp.]MBP7524804.1 hypothetical protein [Propionivibrio sp.]MBP8163023.1 hypothetical protein [Propionivibrio sp.]